MNGTLNLLNILLIKPHLLNMKYHVSDISVEMSSANTSILSLPGSPLAPTLTHFPMRCISKVISLYSKSRLCNLRLCNKKEKP